MTVSPARQGLFFALAGFVTLSLGDAVIKSIAGAWPGTAVAALRYLIGAAGLATILLVSEGPSGFAFPRARFQILRGLAVAAATVFFFSSIFLMPLAEATAIGFTSPMITAILGAVVLKEKVDGRSWAASALAFAGVLLILRPNIAELGWPALLPLAAALSMSLVMIGNRAVAGAGSPLLMQFLIATIAAAALLVTAIAGHLTGLAALRIGWPDWTVIARCALVAISATTAHWLIFMGTTRASAAEIAPMTYVQLLTALLLGIFLFDDWPDAASLAGSAIVIGAGLYLWHYRRD